MKDYKETESEDNGIYTFTCEGYISDCLFSRTFQFDVLSYRRSLLDKLATSNESSEMLKIRFDEIEAKIIQEKVQGKNKAISILFSYEASRIDNILCIPK